MSDAPADSPSSPGEGDGELPADADPGLVRAFWTLVAVFNAALLATGVGVLAVVFLGDPRGYVVAAAGGVLFVAGYRRYRRARDD